MLRKIQDGSTSNKIPAGTVRAGRTGATATLRTPTMLIRAKSNESASTSASPSAVQRSTRATETTGAGSSSTGNSEERPVSPRVDIGPKAYKVFKNRDRLVIRFSVEKGLRRVARGKVSYHTRIGNWFVWDMDTGRIAAKTSKTGYEDKREAVQVARDYRDRYGAYVRFDF